MIKKLMLLLAGVWMSMCIAFAQVDVNKADQASLDSVKGIGPKISKSIVDERTKNGSFKDWADLEMRVKGIGDKNATKMSEAGLTVNGQPKAGAAPTRASSTKGASAKTSEPGSSTPSRTSATTESKGGTKKSTKKSSKSRSGNAVSPAPTD